MIKKFLFLDDLRSPEQIENEIIKELSSTVDHKWYVVRTYKEYTEWIMKFGLPDFISFDYELGGLFETHQFTEWFSLELGREYNGLDCLEWTLDYCRLGAHDFPNYMVHSSDISATHCMYDFVKNKLTWINNKK